MAFGFVVDDDGADKIEAGGAVEFAARLAEQPLDALTHAERCPSCTLLGQPLGCVGIIPTPLSAATEEWLVNRLPDEIESVGGFLLRKAIGDFGYDGARARELRRAGKLIASGPFERHYGPFFRRFVVSSEQLLEELLCAGDIAPAHALAILMHLSALEVDGAVPSRLEDGDKLGSLVQNPPERRSRTRCSVELGDAPPEEPSLLGIRSLIRALYAGFVLDVDVFVIDSDEPRA